MTLTYDKVEKFVSPWVSAVLLLCSSAPGLLQSVSTSPRVIEVLADHDSRYKMEGRKEPEITLKAGEQVVLRVTARKAKHKNRDGAVHGFTLLRAKDQKPIPDWDFVLMPGTQDFTVTAPQQPGEYVVVCTVICSEDHEGMKMKLVVVP